MLRLKTPATARFHFGDPFIVMEAREILIAEDKQKISDTPKAGLQENGYVAPSATMGTLD